MASSSLVQSYSLCVNLHPNANDLSKDPKKLKGCRTVGASMPLRPLNGNRKGTVEAAALRCIGLGQALAMRCDRTKFSSLICYSAANARCSEGQTQTVARESPTITQAPVHSKEKSPDLDDGGTGFPPRDDGDGGGGGGGGGGNWSGGFFLFGFLAFLGFLKDKESEEGYRGKRRR